MQNYFDTELKNIKKELIGLKTSQQKFAGAVPLVTKSIQIDMPLSLNQAQTTAKGELYYQISFDKPTLFTVSFAKYYDDVTKSEDYPRTTRVMYFYVSKLSTKSYLVNALAYGTQWGEGNDVRTLINGGSVVLSNTLTVTATDDFRLEQYGL